jgi:phosphate starvation-inducible PhoH-like protein
MGKQHKKLTEKHSEQVAYFEPRNKKQEDLYKAIRSEEIVLAKGVAGTGKTYVTLAAALSLLGPVYKQIILVKSVTAIPGEEIGFYKGTLEEKMAPVMMSFTWTIDKLCGRNASKDLMDKGIIQVIPLAVFRGLSIDSAIVIVDELQNLALDTFRTVITRIGTDCKYVFLGDTEQTDRGKKKDSCMQLVVDLFANSNLIKVVEFGDEDCVRNPKIPAILNILRTNTPI